MLNSVCAPRRNLSFRRCWFRAVDAGNEERKREQNAVGAMIALCFSSSLRF